MTEAATDSKDSEVHLELKAQVWDTRKVRPWNALLWKAVGELVAFMPSYRDTREGRNKAKQMRVVLVVAGIILLAVGGTADQWAAFWLLLGVVIACLAFVVPVEDVKKRMWRTKIKKKQKPKKVPVRRSGAVVYDGRRVELQSEGERVRRVRVDRGKHELGVHQREDKPCLLISPPGKKKAKTISVCATSAIDRPLEFEGTVGDDDLDRPAQVNAKDWEKLWEALDGRE